MDSKTCLQCGKILKPNRRGVFCGRRCVWRAWHQRSIARGYEAQNLPLAMPPPNSEPILPAMGPERLRAANQLALIARAPADARGYRVGIQPGHQQLMRWFPPARFRAPAMFLLDPFEGPAVPTQGTYAVVYLDGHCLPLGGPRFTLAVEQIDRRLVLTDGDRTFKPRPRGEGGPDPWCVSPRYQRGVVIESVPRSKACRMSSHLSRWSAGPIPCGTT